MSDRGLVLVTGAAGFVGSAVARQALAAGYSVRAMLRSVASLGNLAGLDIASAQADIRDSTAVERAVSGVRFVIHVAADYRLWAPEPSEIIRTNVLGTRTVMTAALRAGVERVVYTSSVATLALQPGLASADESVALAEDDAIGAYKRSKVAAERVVLDMVEHDGLQAVIVNPSTPIGPRDARPTPTGRIIVEAASGRMPAFLDTGLNLVHVDDVAAGHIAALERGRIGERYILGGADVELGEMLAVIARLMNRKAPTLKLPRRLLYPLAYAAEAWARHSRREPFITVDGLHLAKHHMFFTSQKAERELGYVARPYEEGLRDAIAWFRAAGTLR
ncbi:MAG: hopanoid-associated sugar epimerase [Burkholderiaceae bacterium]